MPTISKSKLNKNELLQIFAVKQTRLKTYQTKQYFKIITDFISKEKPPEFVKMKYFQTQKYNILLKL